MSWDNFSRSFFILCEGRGVWGADRIDKLKVSNNRVGRLTRKSGPQFLFPLILISNCFFIGDNFWNPNLWVMPAVNQMQSKQKSASNGSEKSARQTSSWIQSRVARWFIFKQKIPIWVNFGGPLNGTCFYILWSFEFLRPFGIIYGRLV
jgi:hypothetical protein